MKRTSTEATFSFTRRAEQDLEQIIDYTASMWGFAQAATYLAGFEDLALLLARNPEVGTSRHNLANGLLSFPYERHILFYRKRASGIVIIRILHQHMDPDMHL
ncbi:MAG: type II toxin-antitoxin system RelE/ParE family toxin [Gammaproteobacteria bacterium]|nr:MAG: type II toxin-antitoxin system RelE/ParE family toxin [Gammaproteobacteria bacterium]